MQQCILPLAPTNPYHPADFIVSISNKDAHNLINQWPVNWGHPPYPSSILLYGPKSSGKTYLTKIWQTLSNAYLLPNNQLLQGELVNQHKAFIIEDVEAWPENNILYYFNLINQIDTPSKSLLLTSANLSNKFKLVDIRSRINSIFMVKISPPDDQLIKKLIFKLFSINSVKISSQVLNFLLLNLPRQFDQIIMLVARINRFSLTYQRKITVSLIKEVINSKDTYSQVI